MFNTTNAMGNSRALLPTSVMPPRLPVENMSNFGPKVSSGFLVDNKDKKKRTFTAEGSEVDALMPLENSKNQRTPLPTVRPGYPGMNIIVKKEDVFASEYPVPIPYANTINSVSTIMPTLPGPNFEQTPNSQTKPTSSQTALNDLDLPAPTKLNNHSIDAISAIMAVFKSVPPVQSIQPKILGDGNMPWDTMLFTKRAAIANLAQLGRSIKGAVKGRSGKLAIIKITKELAYAECTSVDVKQYILTTPVDARAIRRIWPE